MAEGKGLTVKDICLSWEFGFTLDNSRQQGPSSQAESYNGVSGMCSLVFRKITQKKLDKELEQRRRLVRSYGCNQVRDSSLISGTVRF